MSVRRHQVDSVHAGQHPAADSLSCVCPSCFSAGIPSLFLVYSQGWRNSFFFSWGCAMNFRLFFFFSFSLQKKKCWTAAQMQVPPSDFNGCCLRSFIFPIKNCSSLLLLLLLMMLRGTHPVGRPLSADFSAFFFLNKMK